MFAAIAPEPAMTVAPTARAVTSEIRFFIEIWVLSGVIRTKVRIGVPAVPEVLG